MFPCRVRLHVLAGLFLLILAVPFAKAVDWPPIDPADLAMKDVPQQPGAPGVVLLREENDNDPMHFHSTYVRIKILTEAGREYADVQLPYTRHGFRVDSISGRTVHADGSIVPFDGKLFDKTIERGRGYKYKVKAFTLPDVQVGSIIEFRYSLRFEDYWYQPPEWQIQTGLFQKQADFKYIPFQFDSASHYVRLSHDRAATGVSWTSYVPSKEMQPKEVKLPRQYSIELSTSNVPPFLEEPYSPPSRTMRYRANFYYTSGSGEEDYWKDEKKFWNKEVEGFVNHCKGAQEVLGKTIATGDTTEQKVRKIYAFVAGLENRSYIPRRAAQEEHALEIKPNKNAEDVLQQRSGYHDDLNRLFVALVREADIPAWLMWVPDRSENFFQSHYLSTSQFDAEVAIVQLNGKEVFLDPGTKYCPYGMLNWRSAGNQGMRQSAGKGAEFGEAPISNYNDAMTQRVARIQLTEDGKYEGTVTVGWLGLEALSRRRTAGLTDSEGRKKDLEDEVKKWLPAGSEIALTKLPKWDDTESAFAAEFKVSGPLATSAGKRWMVPIHFFQVNEKPKFPSAKRENPVYLAYPYREIDEVHIALPPGAEMEDLPHDDVVKLDFAIYKTTQKMESPRAIFSRRDMAINGMMFPVTEYKGLKEFYDKMKAGDDQPALLKVPAHAQSN